MTDRERLARAIAEATLAVPGVQRLSPAGPVEMATLYPGGKVAGVRLGDPVEVHVRLDRLPIGPVAQRVRSAVRAVLAAASDDRAVEVTVADVATAALAAVPGR